MRDKLVAGKSERHRLFRPPPNRTAETVDVEAKRGVYVMDRKGEMKENVRHFIGSLELDQAALLFDYYKLGCGFWSIKKLHDKTVHPLPTIAPAGGMCSGKTPYLGPIP